MKNDKRIFNGEYCSEECPFLNNTIYPCECDLYYDEILFDKRHKKCVSDVVSDKNLPMIKLLKSIDEKLDMIIKNLRLR